MEKICFNNAILYLPDGWVLIDATMGMIENTDLSSVKLDEVIIFELRNHALYNAVSHVAYHCHVPAEKLSPSQITYIKHKIVQSVPSWKKLQKYEVHVDEPGLPGLYYDNYGRSRTIEEWEDAPEILLYSFPEDTTSLGKQYQCKIDYLSTDADNEMGLLS